MDKAIIFLGSQIFGFLLWRILVIVPLWRICRRAGFHPTLSLAAIIPWLGFLIVSVVLDLAVWPNLKSHADK